ncbi:hypothetical protein ACFE04_029570 [Oxalis oulophora]
MRNKSRGRGNCRGNGRGIGNQQGSNGGGSRDHTSKPDRGSTGIGNQHGNNGRGSRDHTSQPDRGSTGIGYQQGSNSRGSRDHTSHLGRGSTSTRNKKGNNGRGSRDHQEHTSQPSRGSIGIRNQEGSFGEGSREHQEHTSQPDRGSTGIRNQEGSTGRGLRDHQEHTSHPGRGSTCRSRATITGPSSSSAPTARIQRPPPRGISTSSRLNISVDEGSELVPSNGCSKIFRIVFRRKQDPEGINWALVRAEIKEFYWDESGKFVIFDEDDEAIIKAAWDSKAQKRYRDYVHRVKSGKNSQRRLLELKETYSQQNNEMDERRLFLESMHEEGRSLSRPYCFGSETRILLGSSSTQRSASENINASTFGSNREEASDIRTRITSLENFNARILEEIASLKTALNLDRSSDNGENSDDEEDEDEDEDDYAHVVISF